MPPHDRSLWSDGPSEDDHHAWLDPERTTEHPAAAPDEPTRVRPATEPRARRTGRDAPPPPAPPRNKRGLAVMAVLAIVALLAAGITIGRQSDGTRTVETSVVSGPGVTNALKAAYEATHEGVVRVTTTTGNGTGWVYDAKGTIVTNNHVVSGGSSIKVRFGDTTEEVPAELLGTDISSDLAVLRVDPKKVKKLVPLKLADSDKVKTMDPVIAIGYPLGLDQTTTAGIISGVGRQIQAQNSFSIDRVLQTDAPINPGNSGGPLLDAKGRVVGVNSQIATTGAGGGSVGIGFAIPSNTVKNVVPTLEKGGNVQHAYLGIQMGSLPNVTGAAIGTVTPGGPAARAGLRSVTPSTQNSSTPNGDVIVAIDGEKIVRADDVTKIVNNHKPGDVVELEVSRSGKREKIKVTLGNRPTTSTSSGQTTTVPTNPTNPTNPRTTPRNPTDPLNPTDPTNPGSPLTPGQP